MSLALAGLALAAWLYLLFFHRGFWRADQRLPAARPTLRPATVVAVVPARNEADVVGEAVASLLEQRVGPPLRVVLVDDGSDDGTADAARRAAEAAGAADRLTVLVARPRPVGWTGKLWAQAEGIARAEGLDPPPEYLLLTDADIRHAPDNVRDLVALAAPQGRDLVSVMVRLHCRSGWEKLLIPAFVYFFQKLFPFRAVNDPTSRVAAAAGGCMLVRTAALKAIGGIAAVRDQLIDDCALARALKAQGPIWLGLSADTVSLRAYAGLGGVWRMVARSAYTQLRRSPLLLLATVLGMALIYLVPPLALAGGVAAGAWVTAACGAGACGLMAASYRPTLRLYGLSPAWLAALPAAAALYAAMTVDSARRHWLGRGGEWKGRVEGGKLAIKPQDR